MTDEEFLLSLPVRRNATNKMRLCAEHIHTILNIPLPRGYAKDNDYAAVHKYISQNIDAMRKEMQEAWQRIQIKLYRSRSRNSMRAIWQDQRDYEDEPGW